tara:strand:- start:573 stop:1019 length:447 start_codon:yes stop_codon:yes gene_type:complete
VKELLNNIVTLVKKLYTPVVITLGVVNTISRVTPHPAAKVVRSITSALLIIPTAHSLWNTITSVGMPSVSSAVNKAVDKVIPTLVTRELVANNVHDGDPEYFEYKEALTDMFVDELSEVDVLLEPLINFCKVTTVIVLVLELRTLIRL